MNNLQTISIDISYKAIMTNNISGTYKTLIVFKFGA